MIGGQTIYYDKWFKNGVRFINDLVKDNAEFFSYQEFLERARVQTFYNMWGQYRPLRHTSKRKKK